MASEEKPTKELEGWKRERGEVLRRIEQLKRAGTCYVCRDLETKEVFGEQHIIYENDLFRAVLDPYPRVEGHTIVVYKPHRDDISFLSEKEAGPVFRMCLRIVKAIKAGLGAEKVYLLTMCDGQINHLNFQLMPRWPGNLMGHKRLMMARQPLKGGAETAKLVRDALLQEGSGKKPS